MTDIAHYLDLMAQFDPQRQIDDLYDFSRKSGWGFKPTDFSRLPNPPVTAPSAGLQIVGLMAELNTFEQTFDEAWRFAASHYKRPWRPAIVKTEPGLMRLRSGLEFRPQTLSWFCLDVLAHSGSGGLISVEGAGCQRPAHAQVLYAAGYYKQWAAAWGAKDLPQPRLGGYLLFDAPGAQISKTVHLGYGNGDGLFMNVAWSTDQYPDMCIPEVVV